MKSKKLIEITFEVLILSLGFVGASWANDIFIAQNAAGAGDGSSCANAQSMAWADTASNWGTGTSEIGPGDTVHLCGTINTGLNIQGNGTAGSPIVIKFESGATMTNSVWPVIGGTVWNAQRAAIWDVGYSYITIDGGTNGIINSTDNGTNLDNQDEQYGVYIYDASNVQVENLTIDNMYVPTRNVNFPAAADGICVLSHSGSSNNITINSNTLSVCGNCIEYDFGGPGNSNVHIYGNSIGGASIGIQVDGTGSNPGDPPNILENVSIHDNNVTLSNIWDAPNNASHANGLHLFNDGNPGSALTLKVYDNYIHGDIGVHSTADIFIEGLTSGNLVYNNLIENDVHGPNNGMIFLWGGPGSHIYNNTFISSASGGGVELGTRDGSETGIDIYNNIFFGVGFPIYDDTVKNAPYNGNTTYLQQALAMSDYNIFYINPISNLEMGNHAIDAWAPWLALPQGYDTHSTIANPLFVNASDGSYNPSLTNVSGDYHLTSGSLAIGAGINLSLYCSTAPGLCSDHDGNPRPSAVSGQAWDIGAYQYCTSNCNQGTVFVPRTPTPGTGSDTQFLSFKNVFNPMKEPLTIKYTLNGTDATLKVYDRLGNEIRTLADGTNNGSGYQTSWDGRNSKGSVVASGTYILVLKQGGTTVKKKVVVVK